MPSCDCVCPLARACAWVTWPTRCVPFFSTTLPSCLMSSSVRTSTSSPGLLLFASSEVASVASIFVPLEMLPELFAAFTGAGVEDEVEANDPDEVAEPPAAACAPELFVCTAVCDCAEAPACPETEVCASAVDAPSAPMANNRNERFI